MRKRYLFVINCIYVEMLLTINRPELFYILMRLLFVFLFMSWLIVSRGKLQLEYFITKFNYL